LKVFECYAPEAVSHQQEQVTVQPSAVQMPQVQPSPWPAIVGAFINAAGSYFGVKASTQGAVDLAVAVGSAVSGTAKAGFGSVQPMQPNVSNTTVSTNTFGGAGVVGSGSVSPMSIGGAGVVGAGSQSIPSTTTNTAATTTTTASNTTIPQAQGGNNGCVDFGPSNGC
jgi:hypothetical protein